MEDEIQLAHGSGGILYQDLVDNIFIPAYNNDILSQLNDSAVCKINDEKIALTTDSFVVKPLFFPGGDIGKLAVSGTVNDLSMSGAKAKYLTCGMIIEAGFPIKELKTIAESMAQTAKKAGVMIVTGDTKVVGKGQCDGIYINTAGVGTITNARDLSQRVIQEGDMIILSGSIGHHGMAVMTAREGLINNNKIMSDVAPLNDITDVFLKAAPGTKSMRDPTRGGVAATINEWVKKSGFSIVLDEDKIPVTDEVRAVAELFGLDPLYIANEGRFLAVVPESQADNAITVLRKHPLGKMSTIIGRVSIEGQPCAMVKTIYGGLRLLDMPMGEQLPRIC